jgi:Zn-dependent protease
VLRFSLSGIPVQVHFSFLLIAFILSGDGTQEGLGIVAELTAVAVAVFAAVLLHEAGHAFTARRFGAENISITLFALGGVTTYGSARPLSPGKRFTITAAGSAAGIAVGGPVLLLWRAGYFDEASTLLRFSVSWFMFASVGWGLLNWIPIRPLDGGQMLTSGLEMITPRFAEPIARVVTLLVGATVIVVAVANGFYLMAFFVAFLVVIGTRSQRPPEEATQAPSAEPPGEEHREEPVVEEPPEFPI